MIRALLLLLAVVAAPPAAAEPEPVRVTVSQRDQQFVAEFTLPRSAPAWGFFRSSPAAADNQSWRLKSWTVETPGIRLERRGQFDALVSTDGGPVPRRVRVRLTPFTGDLVAEYVPALALGEGSIALFDGHFSLFSVNQARQLDELAPGFDPGTVGDSGTAIRFVGPSNHLRLAGDLEGYEQGRSAGVYGLFGVPREEVADGVATIIDSELPQWLADDLAGYTPRVMDALRARLGPSGVPRPTILAAWEGATAKGASYNGGALKGLILTRFEGAGAVAENPGLRRLARWFIAHESAHFWLGQAVAYETPLDSWITEGGAELLAVRTVEKLEPSFDSRKFLNDALRECSVLAAKPVATALQRGEHRAYYACGAVFALIAERAQGGDFFAFTRGLIEANRGDARLTGAEWLTALDRASGKPQLSKSIRDMLDRGSADPAASLAGLLKDAGLPVVIDAKGVPQLP